MTPVQNDVKETWSMVNSNLVVADKEGRFPNALVGVSSKRTYLTFVGGSDLISIAGSNQT